MGNILGRKRGLYTPNLTPPPNAASALHDFIHIKVKVIFIKKFIDTATLKGNSVHRRTLYDEMLYTTLWKKNF